MVCRIKSLMVTIVFLYLTKQKHLRSRMIAAKDLPIAGHFGWHKTYDALSQHYYWLGIVAYVQETIRQCLTDLIHNTIFTIARSLIPCACRQDTLHGHT